MPSPMALIDYTTPTRVSFRYSPLMSAMKCSAGQRSAGSECRDDETSLSGTIAGPQSSDPSGQHQAGLIAGPRTLRLCGGGSVSAVVVRARGERAVFIGSISVWDTIGTLTPRSLEIVVLFPPVVRRVMGRKAPRKRLVRRVMACPHGCLARTRTSLGAPPTPHSGLVKQGCKPRAQKCAAGTRWAV